MFKYIYQSGYKSGLRQHHDGVKGMRKPEASVIWQLLRPQNSIGPENYLNSTSHLLARFTLFRVVSSDHYGKCHSNAMLQKRRFFVRDLGFIFIYSTLSVHDLNFVLLPFSCFWPFSRLSESVSLTSSHAKKGGCTSFFLPICKLNHKSNTGEIKGFNWWKLLEEIHCAPWTSDVMYWCIQWNSIFNCSYWQ